ncbi:hypothetical protein IFR05_009373 [Cadophora sp. M221]|nr:hypothetical protein IFR05_009373 [Cadophora sp. M221]
MSSRRSRNTAGWSKWEWSNEHQCYTRWRLNKGAEEWDYKEKLDNAGDSLYSQPIAESSQSAQSQYQYEASKGNQDADDTTSQQFASMTLNSNLLPNPASSYSPQRSGDIRSEFTSTTQPNKGNFMNDQAGWFSLNMASRKTDKGFSFYSKLAEYPSTKPEPPTKMAAQ